MIAHHPTWTSLGIELGIVLALVAGSVWLWLRERRRRRRRALGDEPCTAPMRVEDDVDRTQRGETKPP